MKSIMINRVPIQRLGRNGGNVTNAINYFKIIDYSDSEINCMSFAVFRNFVFQISIVVSQK